MDGQGSERKQGEPDRGPQKIYAYWSAPQPEDVDAFEQHYANTHVPLAEKVPNLTEILMTRTSDRFEGGPTDHYRVAEMVFESPEALAESEESAAWAAMREDSGAIIERFGVTLSVEMGEVLAGNPSPG